MADKIQYIDNVSGDHIYPVAHQRGVLDDDGNSLEPKIQHSQDLDVALTSEVTYTNEQIAAGTKYNYYINSETGNYNSLSTNKHYRLQVDSGDAVYVTANSSKYAYVAFLQSNNDPVASGTPDYATGWTNRASVKAGTTKRFVAPAGARILYIDDGTGDGAGARIPALVTVRKVNAPSYNEPLMKISMAGKDATLSMSESLGGFIPGHIYRAHVVNWPIANVQDDDASHYYIAFYSYNAGGTITTMAGERVTATSIQPFYDFIIPSDSVSVKVIGRCDTDSTGVVSFEDITSLKVDDSIGDILATDGRGMPSKSGLTVLDFTGEIVYNVDDIESGKFYRLRDGLVGVASLSGASYYGQDWDSVISLNENYHNFLIPLGDAVEVEIFQFGYPGASGAKRGSVIVDEHYKQLVGLSTYGMFDTDTHSVIDVGVPQNAKYLVYSLEVTNSSTAYSRSYVKLKYRKRDTELASKVEAIENELAIGGIKYNGYRDMLMRSDDMYIYRFGEMNNLASLSVGDDISLVGWRNWDNSGRYPALMISLNGVSSVHGRWKRSEKSGNYGSIWFDENMKVVGLIRFNNYFTGEVQVPTGAAYLLYSVYTYDDSVWPITLYMKDSADSGIVDMITESDLTTGMKPRLSQGRVTQMGVLDGDPKYVTTDVIFGAFHIALNDGYALYAFHIFNREGELVSWNWGHPGNPGLAPTSAGNTVKFGQDKFAELAQFGLRCTYKRTDGGDVSPLDNVFKSFVKFDKSGLHRWVPDDLPHYELAWRRMMQFLHIIWTPLEKVPAWEYNTGDYNDNFHLPGETQIGLPYSDVASTQKYVPNCVSIRTFLSAASNRRSLLYTEDLRNNISKYGNSYYQGNRASYYGAVCSSFTNWVFNNVGMFMSKHFQKYEEVPNATAYNIRPLDAYTVDGHVAIISAIYKDDFGVVRFVEITEMTEPSCKVTSYTPEEFEARMERNNAVIRRFHNWDQIVEPPEVSDLVQVYPWDIQRTPKFNPDIMTFAGDYAAFRDGDKIILNARRDQKYTGVELYKMGDEDYSLLTTIDITELEPDGIYEDEDDWVLVDLSAMGLTAGLYKACLTDGTNTTDFTYWEVIAISVSAAGTSGAYDFSWNTTGTPLAVDLHKTNGFSDKYHDLTDAEAEAGHVNLNWQRTSTYNRLRLYVQGNYGQVVRSVTLPAQV